MICTSSLNGRKPIMIKFIRAIMTEVVQGKHGVKITSHASVMAETVQKILDVTDHMENRSCWKD